MGDNYYGGNSQYSQYGQQYPPSHSEGRHGQNYSQQSVYTQPQSEHRTYQPPTEEGYSAARASPVPPNMQVAPYDDRTRNRRSGDYNSAPRSRWGDSTNYDEDRYSDRGHGGYLPPPSSDSRRASSRGSYSGKDREEKKSEVASIGATILGGVAGALIGRKAGKRELLPTVIGGVAGAWGGHKLEEEYTERRDEKGGKHSKRHDGAEMAYGGRGRERSRRNSSVDSRSSKKSFKEKVKDRLRSLSRKRTDPADERDPSKRRSSSRKRSTSRRRGRDDSEDSYDDRRREQSRYDSEDRYERDSRYDRDRY